jgi:sugar/nucleoside kinase (ribokinase family)
LRCKSKKLIQPVKLNIKNKTRPPDAHIFKRAARKRFVTCAGILVTDIFAVDLPKVSDPGEITFAPKGIEIHVGGHSANVSIDLRKMGLSEGTVSSVGAVGEDFFGEFIESVLKRYGVVTHLEKVQKVGTSKDLILVVTGQDRRYHVDVGANRYLSPEHVVSVLAEERPLLFYVGGCGMLGKFDEKLAHTLQTAKNYNCLTFVDPVIPLEREWSFLFQALKWADILHCNDVEAFSMTGEKDPWKAAKALIEEGVKFVIISRGERGVFAKIKNITLEIPAFKVPVIDPSGAGDAFCSGVIYKLVQKMRHGPRDISVLSIEDLISILLEGAAAGAACVTAVGATTAVTRENVDLLLKEQETEILKNVLIT